MKQVMQEYFTRYKWVHTSLGLIGNLSFFVGSIFFLWDSTQAPGTWLFIVGSAGMLFRSFGNMFVMAESES